MKVKAGNVMIIDSEKRKDILVNRITKTKEGLRRDGHSMQGEVDIQNYSGFLLDDKATWHDIVGEIGVLCPSLIIMDHLAAFHHQDEDRENQMKKVTAAVELLMSLTGSSVLVLHHFNKRDPGTFFKKLLVAGKTVMLHKVLRTPCRSHRPHPISNAPEWTCVPPHVGCMMCHKAPAIINISRGLSPGRDKRFGQLEKRLMTFRQITHLGRPVIHLNVNIDVVIRIPRCR